MSPTESSDNSWQSWMRRVLFQLETNETKLVKVDEKVTELRIKLEKLETTLYFRSGVWGAIGAAIPIIGAALFVAIKN